MMPEYGLGFWQCRLRCRTQEELLNEMGVELMVSVWPTVDRRSENFAEMEEKGCLIRSERGVPIAFVSCGTVDQAAGTVTCPGNTKTLTVTLL